MVWLSGPLFAPLRPDVPHRIWHKTLLEAGLLPDLDLRGLPEDHPKRALARLQLALEGLREAEEEAALARRPDPFRVGSPQPWVYAVPAAVFFLLAALSNFWAALFVTLLLSAAAAIAGLIRLWTVEDRARKERLFLAEAALSRARADLGEAAAAARARSFLLVLPDRFVVSAPAREALVAARQALPQGSAERAAVHAKVTTFDDRLAELQAEPPADWCPLPEPEAS